MDDFRKLCRAFGCLEELAQGAGGNISVKLDDRYSIIKASGYALSDVTAAAGFTIVNHAEVCASLDGDTEPDLQSFVVTGPRPSLETYFHSFLKKYVVHIHPTVMLRHLCGRHSCCIPYQKPGFGLSKTIRDMYTGQFEIHLQNHGVIYTADTIEELLDQAHLSYERFRTPQYPSLKSFWTIQAEHRDCYVMKLSPAESNAYSPILSRWNIRNLTPDIALFLHNSVLLQNGRVYIYAPTKQKCLHILEVLRSYCESVSPELQSLSELQVAEVLYWPAELYRK